jgi:hypothetical protein
MRSKQRKILLVVMGATALICFTVFNTPLLNAAQSFLNQGKMTAEERIANAEKDLNALKQAPEEESDVIVSLDGLKDKALIKELLNVNGIKVKQLYHAFVTSDQVMNGGYVLQDNENLDEALSKYENNMKVNLVKQLESMKEDIQKLEVHNYDSTDEKFLEEKRAFEAEKKLADAFELRLAQFNVNGVEMYGVKVTGKNKDILKLKENGSVKAIEMVTEDKEKWNPILIGGNNV